MRSMNSGRKALSGSLAIRQAAYASVENLEGRMHLTGSGAQLLSTSPAVFMENQGQFTNPAIRYAYKGNGLNIGMTDQGMEYQFYNASGAMQFDAALVNGRTVTPVGQDPAAATFSFLTGDVATTRSAVPSFSKVVYSGVYAGIDLQTYGLSSQLKYEFHVAPGADYTQIAVQYSGIQDLSIAADGSLQVNLGAQWGSLKDDAPYIYQVINGQQVQVAGEFALVNNDTYTFQITGQYDPAQELVIDPYIAWSSFIGGNQSDIATTVVTDNSKDVIVGGYTRSSGWIDESLFNGKRFNDSGLEDGYVMKFNPDGALLWGVFVGGEYNDTVNGVAADAAGNVYAVGTATGGNWAFGPASADGVMVESYHGGTDSFVMKITPQGQYDWASFIGGTGSESGLGVSVAGNNVVITGATNSVSEEVPGGTLAPNQFSGRWTGYSPSLGLGFSVGIAERATGATGAAEVQILTRSADQPVRGNWTLTYSYTLEHPGQKPEVVRYAVTLPYNATAQSIQDALRAVALANPAENGHPRASDLANIVVTGGPFNSVFPSQFRFSFVGAAGPTGNGDVGELSADVSDILVRGEIYNGGASDAFAAALNTNSGERMWAKYYGGTGTDTGAALAANSLNIFIAGATDSRTTLTDNIETGFLGGLGARSTYLGSGTDAYVLHLNPANGRWMGDTFLNANENGTPAAATAITLDPYGNPVVTGTTRISELWRFDPTGVNGTYTPPTTMANSEVFAASFNSGLVFAKWGVLLSANSAITPGGVAVDPDGTVLIGGSTSATAIQTLKVGGSLANVEFTEAAAPGSNGFVVKLDRQTKPVWGFFVGGNGNDYINAVAIDADHNALVAGTTDTTITSDATTGISDTNWPGSRFSNASSGNGDGFVSKLSIDSTPPTIVVRPLQPVTADNYATLSTYRFTVVYAASRFGEVDAQSVRNSTVAVTRNGDLIGTAVVESLTPNQNDQIITAVYTFSAPNGQWAIDDAGTYSLTLQGGQIRNVDGFAVGAKDTFISLGAFTVDRSRPTVAIAGGNIRSLTATSYAFTVVYDGVGSPISRHPTTLVLSSSTSTATLTATAGTASVDGNKTTVTYTVASPTGGWKEGTRYTITVPAATVFNAGNPNVAASASFFVDSKIPTVSFPKPTTSTAPGSATPTFTVTYNGTGTTIGQAAFPTTLVLSTKLSNGTILSYNASVASSADVTTNGNATVVRYTIPRASMPSTLRKYTITIPAGTVWDQAGNTNAKAVKAVYLKGTAAAAKVISSATASLSPFCSLPLAPFFIAAPASSPLLTTGTSLLA